MSYSVTTGELRCVEAFKQTEIFLSLVLLFVKTFVHAPHKLPTVHTHVNNQQAVKSGHLSNEQDMWNAVCNKNH